MDNLLFGDNQFFGVNHMSEEKARARTLLDMVGIGQRADQTAATQPLGVLKRLEMARALALEPQVVPDAVHRPDAPDVVLRPGTTRTSRISWRFEALG